MGYHRDCIRWAVVATTISVAHASESEDGKIHLVGLNWEEVQVPFAIVVFILLSILARLVFHQPGKLASLLPESCLLITLGVVVGLILMPSGTNERIGFDSNVFFLFLLPPIIFEAGYFINPKLFFDNLWTILNFAVLNTLFNTFAMGLSLYGVQQAGLTGNIDLDFVDTMVFASLISAVDPVAVIAIFEEIHVNELLYMLVFGESVLNDAVSVVLYNTFTTFSTQGTIPTDQIGPAVASFFVVSLLGVAIGLVIGVFGSYITKFTERIPVVEPLVILTTGYLSYLLCELFEFSGILGILFAGIVLQHYAGNNLGDNSQVTVRYLLKMLASTSETIVFMYLGISLVTDEHDFQIEFVAWTIFFSLGYRIIGIVTLSAWANSLRIKKILVTDQFVMAYGGLRGAIAFALAFILTEEQVGGERDAIVTTTQAVILFTVFVQGSTIKPLLKWLHIRLAPTDVRGGIAAKVLPRAMEHFTVSVDAIAGNQLHNWHDFFEEFDRKRMRPLLQRNPEAHKTEIISAFDKLVREEAADMAAARQLEAQAIGAGGGLQLNGALLGIYGGGANSFKAVESNLGMNISRGISGGSSGMPVSPASDFKLSARDEFEIAKARKKSYNSDLYAGERFSSGNLAAMDSSLRRDASSRSLRKASRNGSANKGFFLGDDESMIPAAPSTSTLGEMAHDRQVHERQIRSQSSNVVPAIAEAVSRHQSTSEEVNQENVEALLGSQPQNVQAPLAVAGAVSNRLTWDAAGSCAETEAEDEILNSYYRIEMERMRKKQRKAHGSEPSDSTRSRNKPPEGRPSQGARPISHKLPSSPGLVPSDRRAESTRSPIGSHGRSPLTGRSPAGEYRPMSLKHGTADAYDRRNLPERGKAHHGGLPQKKSAARLEDLYKQALTDKSSEDGGDGGMKRNVSFSSALAAQRAVAHKVGDIDASMRPSPSATQLAALMKKSDQWYANQSRIDRGRAAQLHQSPLHHSSSSSAVSPRGRSVTLSHTPEEHRTKSPLVDSSGTVPSWLGHATASAAAAEDVAAKNTRISEGRMSVEKDSDNSATRDEVTSKERRRSPSPAGASSARRSSILGQSPGPSRRDSVKGKSSSSPGRAASASSPPPVVSLHEATPTTSADDVTHAPRPSIPDRSRSGFTLGADDSDSGSENDSDIEIGGSYV
eukprot:Clim_evm69s157 gene=Clim_evmTU69s157